MSPLGTAARVQHEGRVRSYQLEVENGVRRENNNGINGVEHRTQGEACPVPPRPGHRTGRLPWWRAVDATEGRLAALELVAAFESEHGPFPDEFRRRARMAFSELGVVDESDRARSPVAG